METAKTSKENTESNIRRSKRIAANNEKCSSIMDVVLADLERESIGVIPNKKKKKTRKVINEETGTLFDQGLNAISIIGATRIDDNTGQGQSELSYLVKYENGKYELVLNKVAHKFCPTLIIDFLESRIHFKDNDLSL